MISMNTWPTTIEPIDAESINAGLPMGAELPLWDEVTVC
jgi:hypothetical protein